MQDFRDLPPQLVQAGQSAIYNVPKEVIHVQPFIEQAVAIADQTAKPVTLVHHDKDKKHEIAISISPGSTTEGVLQSYNDQAKKLGRAYLPDAVGSKANISNQTAELRR